MTELEKRIKAKIPGEDTGIEVRRSLCAICSPGHHCGLDCYVKDGKVLKVEGTKEHPYNKGYICAKGVNNRDYIYRSDRLQTPLRRVGRRGEGKFEPITWEEAYAEIDRNLKKVRKTYSPHAVAFFSGYCKWYRPILHRFAYAFGSVNYGSDDSTCNQAGVLAGMMTAGAGGGPDFARANTFLGWAYCGYYSNHLSVQKVQALKARGGKVIIVDSRVTPAAKNLADIFLHINAGTDAALASCMANLIIQNGWADMDYIQRYTYGYEEYAAYVKRFDLETTSKITGLDPANILEATRVFATNGPACINQSTSTLVHYTNGFQTFRAIFCLSALTGNYDRAGGNIPNPMTYLHKPAGFPTREKEFYSSIRPTDERRIAEGKFPIWDKYYDEFQAMDLARQIKTGTPYPVRAIVGVGMNIKMFPETDKLAEAIQTLDFFVDSDLFMTETAKYADILLPACSSLERGELKAYQGGYLTFTKPVIPPLYDSKPDVDWLCELARYMELEDEMLSAGYEACMDWIIDGCGLTVADLKASDLPVKVPIAKPVTPGAYIEHCKTPSGKFEFTSQRVMEFQKVYGLNPLPEYYDALGDEDSEEMRRDYPFHLSTGTRIGTAIHSRLHESPWARSIRPKPLCEIHFQDAEALGIRDRDPVILWSPKGEIRVKAKLTSKLKPGHLQMLHGYSEANVNLLVSTTHLDPYTGFPGFKGLRCNIRKA
nr:molybdopterin-dependent oxidoreductase [uncultured Oscillibacter sp.]